jgi:hypothetical protein
MRRAIVFAVVAWMPAVAWANEAPLRAALEVDAANAGEGHDVIERRVEERGAVVLRDAGVLPAQSRNDPMIHVTISEVGTQDPGYRYRVAIAAEHGWSAEGTCHLCTEGELVQKVEATLAEAASHLPHNEGAVERVPPPSAAREPARQGDADRPPLGKLGKLGKTGVGLLVGGTVLTGIGIGLAVATPRVKEDAPLEKTTTRPPGYALVGIGAATLITGAVLLSIDRTRARRTAVAPTFGRGTAGVVWSGRF